MTESGWPLIPREVLPASVPAAKRRPHPRAEHPPEAGRQLPFFGAETTEPSPADLAGLLVGPGRLGRMGGTARVSVPVDAAWRVHVLVAELVLRGLVVSWRPLVREDATEAAGRTASTTAEGRNAGRAEGDSAGRAEGDSAGPAEGDSAGRAEGDSAGQAEGDSAGRGEEEAGGGAAERLGAGPRFEVLTAYSSRLNGLARAWPAAAAQLFLSGPRLRLWVAAAGEPVPGGYALGLDPAKDPAEVDAALVRAGLAGRVSDDGRQYRIMGRRRVARLAELVGDRPPAATGEQWPGGAGA